ncbi:DUF6907 domain-containing protein [Streptomyces sp. NPDC055210]
MHSIAQASTPTLLPSDQRDSSIPRTYTFTNRANGEDLSFTCMPGCLVHHDILLRDQKVNAVEVVCQASDNGLVALPVDGNGKPEDADILSAHIRVAPFSGSFAERLPHVVLEVVGDHFMDGLDPDALSIVIGVYAERLEALRNTHAELVRVRADYIAGREGDRTFGPQAVASAGGAA